VPVASEPVASEQPAAAEDEAAWAIFGPRSDADVQAEASPDPTGDAVAVAAAGEEAAPSAVFDDDPFIAELRRAITDTEPLGPRDDDEGLEGVPAGDDELRDGDLLDAGRLGSLLRRRR
jgi:hypothetical protein